MGRHGVLLKEGLLERRDTASDVWAHHVSIKKALTRPSWKSMALFQKSITGPCSEISRDPMRESQ